MSLMQELKNRREAAKEARANRPPRLYFITRWVFWNPTRFRYTLMAVVTAFVMSLALYLAGVVDWAINLQQQAVAAKAEREAAKAAVTETPTVDVSTTLPVLPGSAPAAGPTTTTPEPRVAPTTAAATATPGAKAVADTTARGFLKAWAAGAKAASNEAWVKSVAPFAAAPMLDTLRLQDHTSMPADLKVGTVTTILDSATTGTSIVDVGAFGVLELTLEVDAKGKWRVVALSPADGH